MEGKNLIPIHFVLKLSFKKKITMIKILIITLGLSLLTISSACKQTDTSISDNVPEKSVTPSDEIEVADIPEPNTLESIEPKEKEVIMDIEEKKAKDMIAKANVQSEKELTKVSVVEEEVKSTIPDKPVSEPIVDKMPKPKEKEYKPKFEKDDSENPKNKATNVLEQDVDVNVDLASVAGHSVFNELLSTYVSSKGVVDYLGFQKQEAKLDDYLAWLGTNVPASSVKRNERLAYWINAYNAYTIKLILMNYPLKSITDLHGGKPWDVKWIDLGGKTYSLNNIENDIIRPEFNEPRIHFAVNCAAQSCPPLANKAFTASNLESLLEKQTVAFVNNKKYNQLSRESVVVSKIFDWYGKDFGDIASYISKYAMESVKKEANVSYNEYDWSLNGK